MTPALVIFDCDGVLVDSEPLAALAMQSVLREGGIAVELATIAGCVGMKQADIIARLEAVTGHRIGPLLTARLWPATRRLFAEHLASTAGLTDFLDGLPYRRCVASSSSHERIAFSLTVTGLDRYFRPDAVFSASDVARGKPAPDLFLHAAASLNVAPERCVVIEDSPLGIVGAVAAGMTALGFVGGSHAGPGLAATLTANGARVVAESWSAIASWLGLVERPAIDPGMARGHGEAEDTERGSPL